MKKFYSIIAVASVMLTSVFGFTSCQKDEMPAQSNNVNTKNNSQTSTSNKDVKESQAANTYYFGCQMFVNDEVLALGDVVASVTYDGKTVEYKASEGQTASVDLTAAGSAKEQMEAANKTTERKVFSGKKLIVPTFNGGSRAASIVWKFVPNETAFSALDKEGKSNIIVLLAGMNSDTNNISLDVTNMTNYTTGAMAPNKSYKKVAVLGEPNPFVKEFMESMAYFNKIQF